MRSSSTKNIKIFKPRRKPTSRKHGRKLNNSTIVLKTIRQSNNSAKTMHFRKIKAKAMQQNQDLWIENRYPPTKIFIDNTYQPVTTTTANSTVTHPKITGENSIKA